MYHLTKEDGNFSGEYINYDSISYGSEVGNGSYSGGSLRLNKNQKWKKRIKVGFLGGRQLKKKKSAHKFA